MEKHQPGNGWFDEMESDHVWQFNGDGKVAEVRMNPGNEAARIFRLGELKQ